MHTSHKNSLRESNPFGEYPTLQREVEDRYGNYYQQFPFAMWELDRPLRNAHQGKTQISVERLQSAISRSRANLKNLILTRALSKFVGREEKVLFSLDLFERLSTAVYDIYTEDGISVMEPESVVPKFPCFKSRIISRIKLFNIPGYHLKHAAILKNILENGFPSKIDEDALVQLNKVVEIEFNCMRKILKNLNINTIFAKGDSMYNQRLICEALKRNGGSYYTVAHGYVQNPALVSIAPIRSNALVVWTEHQRIEISKALGEEEAKKVFFVGFPRGRMPASEVSYSNLNKSVKRALFIANPVVSTDDFELAAKIWEQAYVITSGLGFRVVFRAHPRDPKKSLLEAAAKDWGAEISSLSINAELEAASCVIGSQSSVLIEAEHGGKPVCQLSDLSDLFFEEVTKIKVTQLEKWLKDVALKAHRLQKTQGGVSKLRIRKMLSQTRST
jgi:hypothetical protein